MVTRFFLRRAVLLTVCACFSVGATILFQANSISHQKADADFLITPDASSKTLNNQLVKALANAKNQSTSQAKRTLQPIAARRAARIAGLMVSDPAEASALLLPDDLLQQLKPYLSPEVLEQPATLTGTLSVISHLLTPGSNSGAGPDETQYTLTETVSSQLYPLYLIGSPPFNFLNGVSVRVTGHILNGKMLVSKNGAEVTNASPVNSVSVAPLAGSGRALAYVSPGNRTILAILVNFQDNTAQPYTQGMVSDTLFGPTNSVNSYFKEVSFDANTFSGDVTPWITLAENVGSSCNENLWAAHARSAATAAGYNPGNYNHVMYIFPSLSVCGWAGSAQLIGSQTWIYSLNLLVTGHEIGHNLGMDHAGSYSCGSKAIDVDVNCSFSEYGSPDDIMGNSSTFDTNAPHQIGLGYFPLESVQTITTNGSYTVAPLENATGVRALKIHNTSGQTDYYIEYRQPLKRDATLPAGLTRGVTINMWKPYGGGFSSFSATGFTEMLDLTPGSGGGFSDASLSDAATFLDSVNGITVTQTSHTSNGATVNVSFGGAVCTPVAPTVSLTPTSQTAAPGQAADYNFSVTNNDNVQNCGTANFTLTIGKPSGWTGSLNSSSFTLAPGANTTKVLTMTSAANATDGVYPISVSTSETGVAAHSATANGSYVVFQNAPPPPPPPTPTPTPPPPTPPPLTEHSPTPKPSPTKKPTPKPSVPTPTPTPTPPAPTETAPSPTPTPTPPPPSASPTSQTVRTASPTLSIPAEPEKKSLLKVLKEITPLEKIALLVLLLGATLLIFWLVL